MNGSDSKIPVTDVTGAAATQYSREDVLAQARPKVVDVLDRGDSYLMLAASAQREDGYKSLDILAACDDAELMGFAIAAISMVGIAQLGPVASSNLPRELQNSIALATGLGAVQRHILAQHNPQTPAADAAKH